MSVACRLGFATRLATAGDSAPASAAGTPLPPGSTGGGALSIPDDDGAAAGASTGGASASATPPPHLRPVSSTGLRAEDCLAAIAVMVDSEATSCLMMGALSPGLKRHAVSLFEAGRVSGSEVVSELLRELWASYEAGKVGGVCSFCGVGCAGCAHPRACWVPFLSGSRLPSPSCGDPLSAATCSQLPAPPNREDTKATAATHQPQGFEGEMRRLTNYCAALATLLEAAQSPAAGAAGTPLELVRKESLAGGWVRLAAHSAVRAPARSEGLVQAGPPMALPPAGQVPHMNACTRQFQTDPPLAPPPRPRPLCGVQGDAPRLLRCAAHRPAAGAAAPPEPLSARPHQLRADARGGQPLAAAGALLRQWHR